MPRGEKYAKLHFLQRDALRGIAAPEALHGIRGPFSHVREWPPCTPKRTRGALPLDPAIAGLRLEELRRLPNRVPAKWCCYTI